MFATGQSVYFKNHIINIFITFIVNLFLFNNIEKEDQRLGNIKWPIHPPKLFTYFLTYQHKKMLWTEKLKSLMLANKDLKISTLWSRVVTCNISSRNVNFPNQNSPGDDRTDVYNVWRPQANVRVCVCVNMFVFTCVFVCLSEYVRMCVWCNQEQYHNYWMCIH